jgi:hypothetical protein
VWRQFRHCWRILTLHLLLLLRCCPPPQGELDMMKQYKEGKEVVLSKVPYWML